MAIPADAIGPTTLALTQAVGAFNAFLPHLSEIRKTDPNRDPSFAADVRMGEVAACALTVGVGAIATSMTGSSAPLVVAVIAAAGLVFMYESTLRAHLPMENDRKAAS